MIWSRKTGCCEWERGEVWGLECEAVCAVGAWPVQLQYAWGAVEALVACGCTWRSEGCHKHAIS